MAFSLKIIEQDGTTLSAEIGSPVLTLSVVADIRLEHAGIVLYNLHLDGPGAGGRGQAASA
jgi:hypothetical protein